MFVFLMKMTDCLLFRFLDQYSDPCCNPIRKNSLQGAVLNPTAELDHSNPPSFPYRAPHECHNVSYLMVPWYNCFFGNIVILLYKFFKCLILKHGYLFCLSIYSTNN